MLDRQFLLDNLISWESGGREQVIPESTQKKMCCSLNSAERRVESERLKLFASFGVFFYLLYLLKSKCLSLHCALAGLLS